MNNFKIIACDTDSVFFKKPDGSSFSEQEIETLQESLNSLYPSLIRWELNDYFPCIVSAAAKNYLIKTRDGKIKFKGSALKDPKKAKALQEFIQAFIILLSEDKQHEIQDLYNKYVREICHILDIKRWTKKITITEKVLNPERTNEQKVYDAVKNIEGLQEGDKVQLFFKSDRSLCLEQDFNGDYDKEGFLDGLYKSALIFADLYPVKEKLLNYKLKRNKSALEALLLHPEDKLLSKLAQTNPKLYKLILNENCKDILKPFTHLKPNETKVIEITNCPKEPVIGTLSLNWDTLNHVEWHEFLLDKIQKVINIGNSLTIVCKDKTILQNLKLHDKIMFE